MRFGVEVGMAVWCHILGSGWRGDGEGHHGKRFERMLGARGEGLGRPLSIEQSGS